MAFYIDKQTLDDLNIFGKRGRDSIYSMYNLTRTRGGEQVMEEMFRYPLADASAINRRSAVIRYMMDADMAFPFKGDVIDTVEYYLSNTDTRTKLSAADNTLQRKLKGAVGADTVFEQLHKGVLACVEIIDVLHRFTEKPGENNPYQRELEELALLVRDPELAPLLEERNAKKLSYTLTAELDELSRFRVREKLLKIMAYIYQLDVYTAAAAVAIKRGLSFATALPGHDNHLEMEGVYHPLVKNVIPNSLQADAAGNVLFLTGANMAGKSTFMKTLSISVFLAHAGFPVPAKRMAFSVLDGMYTTINLPDNLGTGYSHFYAEVMRVKKVAEHLGTSKRLLVVFDELFRGTNVKDAYDATVAISEAFAGRPDSLFVISTHIIEAGDVLRDNCPNVRFIYMPTVMEGSTATYPYILKEGITSDRHGMMIINNENIVDIIRKGGRKAVTAPSSTFATDKQTLEDLNLLGEFRPNSVFNIYNNTKTRGGKLLLEDMFRHPLTDVAAINERLSVFKYFQRQQGGFPISGVVLNEAEQYLKSGSSNGLVSTFIQMGRRKLMQSISNDPEYGMMKKGMEAAMVLIRQIKAFTEKLNRKDVPPTLLPMLDRTERLCASKQLAWVFSGEANKMTLLQAAKRDYLLRARLREEIDQLLETVYHFDLYISVSTVARTRGFCYPAAVHSTNNRISIKGFYHPAIPHAIPNSVSITKEQNVLFLTGANMAGKSTLMKSFSIAVYLAHMGFPVAAEEMEFSVQDGMYTSINVSDNLTLGHSHFYAEVLRVKHVAEEVAAGKNLVVVFDELFKGTNVKDAFDATVAVTDAFGEHRNCAYIISTHIIEVGHTLSGIRNNLQFVYMPTVMKEGMPHYPYALRSGITDDRHGMVIIQNEKIIDIIRQGSVSVNR